MNTTPGPASSGTNPTNAGTTTRGRRRRGRCTDHSRRRGGRTALSPVGLGERTIPAGARAGATAELSRGLAAVPDHPRRREGDESSESSESSESMLALASGPFPQERGRPTRRADPGLQHQTVPRGRGGDDMPRPCMSAAPGPSPRARGRLRVDEEGLWLPVKTSARPDPFPQLARTVRRAGGRSDSSSAACRSVSGQAEPAEEYGSRVVGGILGAAGIAREQGQIVVMERVQLTLREVDEAA